MSENETIHESHTGGKKGKKLAQFSQVPPEIERQIAEIFALGAEKYGRGNWMLGYDWDLNYDAARRHLGEFWAGEDFNKKDFPEHEVKHVLQAAWHCIVLAWFMDNKREFDTRPTAAKTVTILPTINLGDVQAYDWIDKCGSRLTILDGRLTRVYADLGRHYSSKTGGAWERAALSTYGPYTRVEK